MLITSSTKSKHEHMPAIGDRKTPTIVFAEAKTKNRNRYQSQREASRTRRCDNHCIKKHRTLKRTKIFGTLFMMTGMARAFRRGKWRWRLLALNPKTKTGGPAQWTAEATAAPVAAILSTTATREYWRTKRELAMS